METATEAPETTISGETCVKSDDAGNASLALPTELMTSAAGDDDNGREKTMRLSSRLVEVERSAPPHVAAEEEKQRRTIATTAAAPARESSAAKPPSPDEENIARAEAFLRSDDIRDVPAKSKRMYLEGKAGMTSREIDAALERVAVKERVNRKDDGDDGDGFESGRQSRYGEDYDPGRSPRRYDDDRFGERQHGYNRHGPNNDRYNRDDSYGNNRHRRGPVAERRPPPPQYPSRHDSGNSMPPDNNNMMHLAPGAVEEMSPSSTSLLPAWAGGFSMGVFCLAALRWLNGGDFVLIPPPSASAPLLTEAEAKNEGDPRLNANEEDTDESDSNQQEEGDVQGDNAEYEEVESGSNDDDDDDSLDMILNGAANIWVPSFKI